MFHSSHLTLAWTTVEKEAKGLKEANLITGLFACFAVMKDNYKCFICHGSFFGVQKCCLIEFYWLFQSHTHTHSLTPSPPPILLLTLTIDEHVTHEPTFLTQKEDGKERGKIKLARKKKKENHREGNKLLDNFTEHRERERERDFWNGSHAISL